MNKKKLIIIISIAVVMVIGVIVYSGINKYLEEQRVKAEKATIVTTSKDFVNAWYNYTNQTNTKYLATIQPYMTPPFYSATHYLNTERPQDFAGQESMKSTVLGMEVISLDDTTSNVSVEVSSREGGRSAREYSVSLTLEKNDGTWLVSQLEIPVE